MTTRIPPFLRKYAIVEKNNLFVLHTQYNLILATGLIKNQFSNQRNDLILNAEFELNTALKKSIDATFDQVLILQSTYQLRDAMVKIERQLYKKYRHFKKFKPISKNVYDQVFISQEDMIDTLIARDIHKNGPTKMTYIEDGVDAYFSINPALNELDIETFTKQQQERLQKRSVLQKSLSMFRNLVYGSNKYYEPKYCYGMNKNFVSSHVLFPGNARKELAHTKLIEIQKKTLLSGIENLYGSSDSGAIEGDRVIVIFLDLIDRVPKELNFSNFLEKVLAWSSTLGAKVLFKYHPREVGTYQQLSVSSLCTEINKLIPSEKLISDLEGKNVTVIGNLSTSLIVAKKIGFEVICIADIVGVKNTKAYDFFKAINIHVPQTFEALMPLLE